MRKTILAGVAVLSLAVSLAYAVTTSIVRYTYGGTQVYALLQTGWEVLAGPRLFGSSSTSPTIPTTTTGANFANWVPVYNPGSSSISAGTVLVASNTGTGYVAASAATIDLTTVVGVAAQAISSASNGWMVPRGGGYAVVNATGTVSIGDILVTTPTYAGGAGVDTTPTTGADFGTAMSSKSGANAGTVLAILH